MTERIGLLNSLATTIADYRAGELTPPTLDHVERWVQQFDGCVQVPLLREVVHVLKTTYFSRASIQEFLAGLAASSELAGAHPSEFWRSANFLNIQQNGNSQREMLDMFDGILVAEYGLSIDLCGLQGGAFIYLDDVMFSGNRIGNDLETWIRDAAPSRATVHVVVIAIHSSGEYLTDRRLRATIEASGKKIGIKYWRAKTIENRKSYKNASEVLWPAKLPDDADLNVYLALAHKFPFEPRALGGKLGPFSSEPGRQILERELLLAGVKIRANCANPKDIMRPLGFSPFGLGFGSMIVTFRNCPNNCPLALWWGDPYAGSSSPLSKWYPLFPRKTYTREVSIDGFS